MPQRVLLMSGGMDSTAVAYVEQPDLCLTIDYGHVAAPGELRAARAVANALGIQHEAVAVDCKQFGSGDLAGLPALASAPVPEWWPFRNQMLVTVAAMHAVKTGPTQLLLGAVSTDSSHADGRADFILAMDRLLAMQEGDVSLVAPAILTSTIDFARAHSVPHEILAWAHSCHTGEWACGECRGCAKYVHAMRGLFGDAPVSS